MLDFLLVLGQIPGTNFQITFTEFLVFCLLFIAWLYRYRLRKAAICYWKKTLKRAKQKMWARQQLSLPV